MKKIALDLRHESPAAIMQDLVRERDAKESVFRYCEPEVAESAAMALHLAERRLANHYQAAKREYRAARGA